MSSDLCLTHCSARNHQSHSVQKRRPPIESSKTPASVVHWSTWVRRSSSTLWTCLRMFSNMSRCEPMKLSVSACWSSFQYNLICNLFQNQTAVHAKTNQRKTSNAKMAYIANPSFAPCFASLLQISSCAVTVPGSRPMTTVNLSKVFASFVMVLELLPLATNSDCSVFPTCSRLSTKNIPASPIKARSLFFARHFGAYIPYVERRGDLCQYDLSALGLVLNPKYFPRQMSDFPNSLSVHQLPRWTAVRVVDLHDCRLQHKLNAPPDKNCIGHCTHDAVQFRLAAWKWYHALSARAPIQKASVEKMHSTWSWLSMCLVPCPVSVWVCFKNPAVFCCHLPFPLTRLWNIAIWLQCHQFVSSTPPVF